MSSITQAGRDLLAAATSIDRLVFCGAWLMPSSYSDATLSAMTALPSTSGAASGEIGSVVYIDGTARATAVFLGGTNATYYTAILMARLDSQSDAQAVPFAGYNDNGIYLPPSGGLDSQVSVDFNISFLDDSGSVSITETAAAPVSYVDALRNDVYNGARAPARVYRDFIDAQARMDEGEVGFLCQNSPSVFYIKPHTYDSTSSFMKHRIIDVCDHIMSILIWGSTYTYVEFYDLRDVTVNGMEITLPSPFIYAQLGDEGSNAANVRIAKIGTQYYAVAYNNSSSSNQWWYNANVGQSSSEKVVGYCAAMPLGTYTIPYGASTMTLTMGRWYCIDAGTTGAMRVIGRDVAIYNQNCKSTSYACALVRLVPSYSVSGDKKIIFNLTYIRTLDSCYVDYMYQAQAGSGPFVRTACAASMADGCLVYIVLYSDGYGNFSYSGAMEGAGEVQELDSTATINQDFYAQYGISTVSYITAASGFSYPTSDVGVCNIYKSGKGLWCAVSGYWVKFEAALNATYFGNNTTEAVTCQDTNQLLLNGTAMANVGANYGIELFGAEGGSLVASDSTNISYEFLTTNDNITCGVGLLCAWCTPDMYRLWLMYSPKDTYNNMTMCAKIDGMI